MLAHSLLRSFFLAVYEGHMGGIYACAFSRDSKFGASASWDKTVKVWDFEKEPDESCVATFQGHTGRVLCCSFSPCQTYVLSGSKDATLRVWSVERLCGSNRIDGTRSAATAEEGAGEEEQKRCVGILRGHTSRVHSCAFSPSSGIAASASGDCTVRLWDVSTSTCLSQFVAHTDSVLRCVFSESGKFLMTASQDKNVKIWDLTKIGECVRTIRCTAKMSKYRNKYWGAIHGCAWSISSKLIVCGGTDRNVHVHDRTTGRHICALPGHGNSITCTAFSTTGYFLCTGSKDMTVRIWFLPKRYA